MMILMAMAVFYGSSYLCIWRPVYGSSYLLTWQPFYGPSYLLTWDAWWFFHKSRRLIWLYILVLCLFTLIELFRGLNVMNFSIVKLQLDDSFKWIFAVWKEGYLSFYIIDWTQISIIRDCRELWQPHVDLVPISPRRGS